MSYVKQNFTDGQTLTAAMLNKIESGITQHDTELAQKQPKGDYVTTDAQTLTEGQKSQARINIGAVSAEYIIGVFEELKSLIQAGDTDAVIATLDNAILDMHILA